MRTTLFSGAVVTAGSGAAASVTGSTASDRGSSLTVAATAASGSTTTGASSTGSGTNGSGTDGSWTDASAADASGNDGSGAIDSGALNSGTENSGALVCWTVEREEPEGFHSKGDDHEDDGAAGSGSGAA